MRNVLRRQRLTRESCIVCRLNLIKLVFRFQEMEDSITTNTHTHTFVSFSVLLFFHSIRVEQTNKIGMKQKRTTLKHSLTTSRKLIWNWQQRKDFGKTRKKIRKKKSAFTLIVNNSKGSLHPFTQTKSLFLHF